MKPKLALIVDDDAAIRKLLCRVAERAGFDTVEAADGVEALNRAAVCGWFDVIILDLMMPRMSGFDVLANLQRRNPSQVTRVLVLSAASDEAITRAHHLPIRAVLRKPFDMGTLLAILSAIAKEDPVPRVVAT